MAKIESSELLKCSFCGKSQKQVQQLIAGPQIYICDECISVCADAMMRDMGYAMAQEVEMLEERL